MDRVIVYGWNIEHAVLIMLPVNFVIIVISLLPCFFDIFECNIHIDAYSNVYICSLVNNLEGTCEYRIYGHERGGMYDYSDMYGVV